MITKDLISQTYGALSANKSRTGLTMLGIIIGIASVIAMVSIGQGVGSKISSNIESLGANILTIRPGAQQASKGTVSSGRGSAQTLKNGDVEVIRSIEGISAVSPEFSKRYQVLSSTGNNTNTTVYGATPDYVIAHNIEIDYGSFLTSQQSTSVSKVAVIGPTVATDLYGEEDPIGKTVRINSINFKIIGVLKSKGGTSFNSPDEMIFVSLATMQKVLSGADYLSTISVSVTNKDDMDTVKAEIISVLAKKHNLDEASADFSILSQSDIMSSLNQITSTFTLFLAAIAGISLVVGGIGIMNMMLTTVTERTREIGLRKAVGAKGSDISKQFLVEAVMLTFVGGVIGVVFGWLISMIISSLASINTVVSLSSVLLAFGVSAVIGIVFGYYPAKRAASLNPIEALRYE